MIAADLFDEKDELFMVEKHALDSFRWISFVVNNNLPFTVVASSETLEIANNISQISPWTLIRRMQETVKVVKDKIVKMLPDHFGLMLDAWKTNDQHFTCVYAVGHGVPNNGCTQLGVLTTEMKAPSSTELFDFILDKLVSIGADVTSVLYLVAEPNPDFQNLAQDLKCPMVDCFCCRLEEAVLSFLGWHESHRHSRTDDNRVLVTLIKVNLILSVLKSYMDKEQFKDMLRPFATCLSNHTMPKVEDRDLKSICGMVRLYLQCEKLVCELSNGDTKLGRDLNGFILNETESDLLCQVNRLLDDANCFSFHMEKKHWNLSDVRFVTNKLCDLYGKKIVRSLSENSAPVFQSAVAKQIAGESLSKVEEKILAPFVLEGQQQDAEDISTSSHVLKQLVEYRNSKAAKKKYIGLEEIPATIVQVRKTFTKAGKIRTATKNRMNAGIFEDVMFWLVNKDLITPVDVEQAMREHWLREKVENVEYGDRIRDFEEMEP